ncbi:hypothetical protein [Anaerocolumna sp.]|uniref:hypothetical protein n=1 Tax=Anaerocolumna sp. TaxID=2041569 RepID=UPI0028A6B211|nr:hypothetical protein [Anaerocolumna sp.]
METSAKQYRKLSEAIITSLSNCASDEDNVVYWRRVYTFLKAMTDAEVVISKGELIVRVNGVATIVEDK